MAGCPYGVGWVPSHFVGSPARVRHRSNGPTQSGHGNRTNVFLANQLWDWPGAGTLGFFRSVWVCGGLHPNRTSFACSTHRGRRMVWEIWRQRASNRGFHKQCRGLRSPSCHLCLCSDMEVRPKDQGGKGIKKGSLAQILTTSFYSMEMHILVIWQCFIQFPMRHRSCQEGKMNSFCGGNLFLWLRAFKDTPLNKRHADRALAPVYKGYSINQYNIHITLVNN